MSHQEVHFQVGRQALVWDVGNKCWRHAEAVVWYDNEVWRTHIHGRCLRRSSPTRRLPDQCSECFEVSDHAFTCIRGKCITGNVARGVPAALAEWVMWTAPDVWTLEECNVTLLWLPFHEHPPKPAILTDDDGYDLGGMTYYPGEVTGCPLLALGREGFTRAPWGLRAAADLLDPHPRREAGQ